MSGEDAVVFGEYLALLEYKLARQEELDRRIEELALEAEEATPGAGASGDCPCLEGPASPLQALSSVAARRGPQITAVAVARELVGFLWAVLQDLESEVETVNRQAA